MNNPLQNNYGLEVESLQKHYRLGESNVLVLKGLDVQVEPGELVVIMGPSGSGKTTLLNCISGIDIPDRGRVVIKGETVDMSSEHSRTLLRRQHIGIVFQFFNLIPTLKVNENVALPFHIAQRKEPDIAQRVEAILDTVGLKRRRHHYPYQLYGRFWKTGCPWSTFFIGVAVYPCARSGDHLVDETLFALLCSFDRIGTEKYHTAGDPADGSPDSSDQP